MDHFTFWLSFSLMQPLTSKFGLRPKIAKIWMVIFFIWTQCSPSPNIGLRN